MRVSTPRIPDFGIIHALPGSDSIFRISADVGLLLALEKEPILLLQFWRSRDDSVLLQDGHVSRPLVLPTKEKRVERDLIGRDANNAERIKKRIALSAVLRDEDIVGCLSAKRFVRIAVEVRKREAYLLLRERVETRPLLEDAPKFVVEALDVWLL